jgi:hypothetical protein
MKKMILFVLATTLLASCSVMMAARKEGVSVNKVQTCCTRNQILATGPCLRSSERLPTGELVEIYQFQNEKGSTARAFMHGLLDVSTCGLWEIVGTPIEGSEKRAYYIVRITYDRQEVVQRMELL